MAHKKRPDLKKILADPDLRRKLMVSTIQATQAREGIETTAELASQAYYVVTEGEKATFFDLQKYRGGRGEPDRRHEVFVKALRGEVQDNRVDVARGDFSEITGAPLAYRHIGKVAHIFREAVTLDPHWGIARQGKATGDDGRWIRQWWEVVPNTGWVPFAKGGEFSRFYSDVDLVLDWKLEHRDALKASGNGLPSLDLYFHPGLTWPRRTAKGFNIRRLPKGCIFADKGPALFPTNPQHENFLLGICNSIVFEFLFMTRTSFSWEVGIMKAMPIPQPSPRQFENVVELTQGIYDAKSTWDQGNEASTKFVKPWLIRKCEFNEKATLSSCLDQLTQFEAAEDARIQMLYAKLNNEVYRLYGISDTARKLIEETLRERPPEIIWPQMEGKSQEQKHMEHVWRLLSFAVKSVLESDEDGIVPFIGLSGEPSLLDRVYKELESLFLGQSISQVEVDIINELKRKVKGYRSTKSILEWLEDVFFEYHASLYKNRPIFWHISSTQGRNPAAFGALVHYHKFDKNRMAKLRGNYLRDAVEFFRREAALAAQQRRESDRLEWQAKLEEAQDLDRRLQLIQEGHHEGPEGGSEDFRILTLWKSPEDRPKGWDPELDDGVKVNLEPLQKAGVLRISKVV